MLSSFRSALMRALGCTAVLPVRMLRPLARGKTAAAAGLYPHQWLLLLGMAGMYCVPHGQWNNMYAAVFAAVSLAVYWWDCAARSLEPENPAILGSGVWLFLAVCFFHCLGVWQSAGNLRVAVFYAAGFVLAYLIAAGFRDKPALDALLAALWAALMTTAVYGLYVHFTRGSYATVPIDGVETARLCSTLEHGINYGEFVAMLLPVELAWALQRPTKTQRVLLSGPLLVPLTAMLFTYSRTGWVSLAAAVLVLLWMTKRRLLLPVLVLGAVSVFFLPQSVQSRLLTMLHFSDAASSGRFTLWRECLALLREHWLWGIGLGPENFSHAYLSVSTGVLPFDPPHANMLFLEVVLSLGVLGAAAFLVLFFGILLRLKKALIRCQSSRERLLFSAIFASLCGAAVGAVPEHIWFYPRVMFCWCMLYGLALGQISSPSE